MTDLVFPPLPRNYCWHGRAIVIKSESEHGVPIIETVAVPTPETIELFLGFLDAWGKMFFDRGVDIMIGATIAHLRSRMVDGEVTLQNQLTPNHKE